MRAFPSRSTSPPSSATASRRSRKGGLALFVSQSGETADTLATLRYCKAQGQRIASIVNVRTSTIARESDVVLPTLAGPEIGVASTKAFTCQLSVLACLAIALGRARGTIGEAQEKELRHGAGRGAAPHLDAAAQRGARTRRSHTSSAKARDVLYLGRGISYPIALEGALKLKEISYIHAEGYAAGELKHGPIALIDENVPVIVVAPAGRAVREDRLQHAGGGGPRRPDHPASRTPRPSGPAAALQAHIEMPDRASRSPIRCSTRCRCSSSPTTRPSFMGTDVDQPRNLAKSVTVE